MEAVCPGLTPWTQVLASLSRLVLALTAGIGNESPGYCLNLHECKHESHESPGNRGPFLRLPILASHRKECAMCQVRGRPCCGEIHAGIFATRGNADRNLVKRSPVRSPWMKLDADAARERSLEAVIKQIRRRATPSPAPPSLLTPPLAPSCLIKPLAAALASSSAT